VLFVLLVFFHYNSNLIDEPTVISGIVVHLCRVGADLSRRFYFEELPQFLGTTFPKIHTEVSDGGLTWPNGASKRVYYFNFTHS